MTFRWRDGVGEKMRVWCSWFCALLMLDLLLEAQVTKWNANTWTTEEPMSQKPGMCDCKASTGSLSRSGGSGSPKRVPGFQMKLWCLHHPIFSLCPVCSDLASSVKPEPRRKLAQTYQRCPEPAISNSQGPALAAFSSCRRNQEGAWAHHSFYPSPLITSAKVESEG